MNLWQLLKIELIPHHYSLEKVLNAFPITNAQLFWKEMEMMNAMMQMNGQLDDMGMQMSLNQMDKNDNVS